VKGRVSDRGGLRSGRQLPQYRQAALGRRHPLELADQSLDVAATLVALPAARTRGHVRVHLVRNERCGLASRGGDELGLMAVPPA